jgi:hypothetical protein
MVEETTWRGPWTTTLWPAYRSMAARASRAHPGLAGLMEPGVLPLLCPVNDFLSPVEVDSSRLATRLLFLASTMSCVSIVQPACQQCQEATDDGGFKITKSIRLNLTKSYPLYFILIVLDLDVSIYGGN